MTSQSGVDTLPGEGKDTLGSARTVSALDSRPPDADSDIDDSFLVGVAAAPSIDPDVPTMLMPGAHVVGKYRIEARIGQGGMGTVYRAIDTRLQRPVAIKIHHARQTRVERLRREARLLARLSHPNVVTVLEVGTHDGMLFVAMEFVDGGSARGWLRRTPRSWREIVELYREAGRGLAAAHELGIVHRDFKPDNVLVGSDGRPRVADFGLAGWAVDAQLEEDPTIDAMTGPQSSDRHAFATEVGVMVGTPAYVAPEQIGSSRVDARADQFGFCAALFEALYGELPFPGRTVQEIVARIARGELEQPSDPKRAPPWVLAVLERGLERDPAARYPDMNALLAALARPPRTRVLAPLLALGGVLAVFAAAFAQVDAAPDVCTGDSPSERWLRARQELGTRVAALGQPAADQAWAHLEERFAAHTERWSTTREAVCEAAITDSVADVTRRARELACLADGASEIDALVAEIAEPDTIALTRAAEVTEHLADPERCIGALPSVVAPPPAAIAADVEALRGVLATCATRVKLGRANEARALADVVTARAQQLGYGPLVAEALLARAVSRATVGMLDLAVEDAAAAYEEARRAGDEQTIAHTADLRAQLAFDHGDLDQALRWNNEARAHIQRLSEHGGLFVAMITREAEIRAHRDEADAARVLLQQAERFVEEGERGDELRARVEHARAEIALLQGDYGGAIEGFERARDAYIRAYGAWHHLVAYGWHEIAVTYIEAGNYVEARNAYLHALEIYERTGDAPVLQLVGIQLGVASCEDMLGNGVGALERVATAEELYNAAGHDNVWMAQAIYEARGVILIGLGRGDEALAAFEQALPAAEQRWGEAHSELRLILSNMALAAREAGRSELAERYLQRALRIQSALAKHDEQGAALLHSYGFLLLERGQLDAAAEQFERAGNVIEELIGIDAPDMGWVELGRGRIALMRRNYELARLSLERAEALWSGDAIPPEDRADLQRDLAVALWETGDRARAVAVARAAAEVTPDDEVLRAWLAAHRAK